MVSLNTLGAVPIGDGGVPRTFTGKARETIVSADLVVFSGAAGAVGSSASSFSSSDIEIAVLRVGASANGICVQSASSGGFATYAREGDYLLRAAGAVTGGAQIKFVSGTIPGVTNLLSGSDVGIIGRAVTTAASGTANYALISLKL